MSRLTAWSVHLAVLVVGGTGVVYGWMRYFAEPADEFAIVNHPWQPDLQAWHIVTAPVLLFVCALIWTDHVWRRIAAGVPVRRSTGLLLAILFGPMVLSGYLLQVSADETWRSIWIWTHAVGSTLWFVIYGVHQLGPRPGRSRRSRAPTS